MGMIDHFKHIKDPRIERTKKHSFIDILIITVCATMAGAEGWDEIVFFANSKKEWLKKYLLLENGIPSSDTIRRTISRVNPKEFEAKFFDWVNAIFNIEEKSVMAIDGKTICNKRIKNPIHIVSAWCNLNKGISLGQVKTEEKSNEITAIPELLKFLEIKGCIVTIDAMGCQKEIAQKIVENNEAEFILTLKKNQPTLYHQVENYFSNCDGMPVDGATISKTSNKGHGRIEERIGYISNSIGSIPELENWPTVKAFGLIIRKRTIKDVTTIENSYYILSKKLPAKKILASAREHWGIENKLHWVLDVTLNEDGCRINNLIAAENMSVIRKSALILMKKVNDKNSIKQRKKLCSWDDSYLELVMKSGI